MQGVSFGGVADISVTEGAGAEGFLEIAGSAHAHSSSVHVVWIEWSPLWFALRVQRWYWWLNAQHCLSIVFLLCLV
jgi:hypothetical protein